MAWNGNAEPAIVPEGEAHVLLDGGRKNNSVFSTSFGAVPGVKRAKTTGPRTIVRQTTVLLNEASASARARRPGPRPGLDFSEKRPSRPGKTGVPPWKNGLPPLTRYVW